MRWQSFHSTIMCANFKGQHTAIAIDVLHFFSKYQPLVPGDAAYISCHPVFTLKHTEFMLTLVSFTSPKQTFKSMTST